MLNRVALCQRSKHPTQRPVRQTNISEDENGSSTVLSACVRSGRWTNAPAARLRSYGWRLRLPILIPLILCSADARGYIGGNNRRAGPPTSGPLVLVVLGQQSWDAQELVVSARRHNQRCVRQLALNFCTCRLLRLSQPQLTTLPRPCCCGGWCIYEVYARSTSLSMPMQLQSCGIGRKQ